MLLGYVVEVFDKNEWEDNNVLHELAFITTLKQFHDFLVDNPNAEHYNDEIIDGITHMYYMI